MTFLIDGLNTGRVKRTVWFFEYVCVCMTHADTGTDLNISTLIQANEFLLTYHGLIYINKVYPTAYISLSLKLSYLQRTE